MLRAPVLATLAALAVMTAAAAAQSPPAGRTPSPTQVKAAELATEKAKDVTYALMRGTSRLGTVGLRQIGRTRTRVTITLKQPLAPPGLSIVPGDYCQSGPGMAKGLAQAGVYALRPVNSSSGISQSIVQLPLEDLRSGKYAVRMRTVNKQNAIAETCGTLSSR